MIFFTSKEQGATSLCMNLAIRDFKIFDLWNLETIGILDTQQNLTKAAEEEMDQEQFLDSLTQNEDGR